MIIKGYPGYLQGITSGSRFADIITDVICRGRLGYIPGFQVYVHCVGCKTELLSSAGTSRTAVIVYFSVLLDNNSDIFNLWQ